MQKVQKMRKRKRPPLQKIDDSIENNDETFVRISNSRNSYLEIQKKAIMTVTLKKLVDNPNPQISMTDHVNAQSEYVDDNGNDDLNYLNKTFVHIYNLMDKCKYFDEFCRNPESFYIPDIPIITFYDVYDYFREPIFGLDEKSCKCGIDCWAYKTTEAGGGGYGISLRRYKDYDYCICCLRKYVNGIYIKRKFKSTDINSNGEEMSAFYQPHSFIVDKPPLMITGKFYYNYSSKFMLRQKKDEKFLGIYGSYPYHNSDRYKPDLIRKEYVVFFPFLTSLKEKLFVLMEWKKKCLSKGLKKKMKYSS